MKNRVKEIWEAKVYPKLSQLLDLHKKKNRRMQETQKNSAVKMNKNVCLTRGMSGKMT